MLGTIFLTKSWNTIIAEFLSNHSGAPKTRATYERALRPWLDFLKKEDKGLDIPLISRYKRLLDGRELSGHTVAAYITAVRTLLDWLVKTGQIEYNPAKEISKLKRPDSSRDALTEQELVKLLTAIDHLESTPENIRNRAVLLLMLYTGLREISIINADIGDIKSKAGKYILFYRPKGSTFKDKFVVLETPPYEAINKYLDQRGQYDAKTPLFVSCSHRNDSGRLTTRTIHRIIAGCYKKAGIRRPGIQPHSLRHCAGTFAAMRGGDPRQIKDMLGHSKVETSMGYTHSQDRVTNSGEHLVHQFIEGVKRENSDKSSNVC